MIKNLNIGAKTTVGIAILILFGIGVVAVSILSIGRINGTLNQITDVAAPTVETSADVTFFVNKAHKVAIEILADEELADIAERREVFAGYAQSYKNAVAELDEYVSDPGLQTTLEETGSEWETFHDLAQSMFAAHIVELEEELKARDLLARFEVGGTELIARLAEIANAQETEMQAAEDRADELAEIPTTTARQLNDLIGELFEVDYPAYEAAVQLQLIVAVLEGAAREYMASENPDQLDSIRTEFTDAYALVAPQFAVLIDRSESDAERAQIEALSMDLSTWVENTQADEQLFDTHRDMLQAEFQADRLAEEMNTAAAILIDTLDTVSDTADAVSDGADEQAAQQVTTARVTMLGLLAGMIAVGAAIGFANARLISRPIQKLTETMEQVSSGDLSAELERTERTHEIGKMTNAMVVFLENSRKARELDASLKAKEQEEAALKQQAAEREAELEAQRMREKEEREAAARAEREEMMRVLGESIGAVVSQAKIGNFSSRVEVSFDDQTLSTLSANVNELLDAVDTGLSAAGATLSRIAQGDLTQTMQGQFQGAFKELQSNTNAMIEALQDLIGGMAVSTDNLANSSSELSETSESLSKQTEQNAAALEETSAALEQLSASIKQVDQNIKSANDNARLASDSAKKGSTVAVEAAEAMNRIDEASKEISKVVSVINDIAFQINLLALNAGVEAARAGEAGRGFSVVASEVRQLAQRASEASNEIAAVISRSDAAVSDGVEKVKGAEASLQEITESIVDVSGSIDGVAQAISEQVNGVGEINTAVGQVDQNTQKQAASFEELAAASKLLSNEADGLKASAARFKTGNEIQVARSEPVKRPAPIAERKAAVPPVTGNLAQQTEGWEDF
ncbi:methyl-accepting chemotaxis protein [Roseobacter sinensis]|uniref:Methyl-accepting chemotaxis protein n=1 Tax=Roseobacter sinensis TaxID=2931391 RepID=A0ABT3BD66_9RHOB|nr:methyl-accepting chemotaxis protein [Roseobacter sp. WL0113]MCV3271510.1 methyl-accepting chemotaxis protein [Roseobacter sp. WL0113]